MRSDALPNVDLIKGDILRSGDAIADLKARLLESPRDVDLQRQLGIACFLAGETARGLKIIQALVSSNPFDILSLAYLGSFQALSPDRSALELFDFENQILIQRLFAHQPESTHLNDQLAAAVLGDPDLKAGRSGKSTINGLQTREIWPQLAESVPLLGSRLRRAVDEALVEFGCGPSGFGERVCHITAWGVVLDRLGYQEPHVHPSGILSGVYYVRVPELPSSRPHAGNLRFRKQPPWIAADEVSDNLCRYVHPHAGDLVMFPSYFWHDTIPFDDTGTRISIAFDVLAPQLLPQEHE
jgi:uncharacterized protein (TIGR02466 family)